MVFEAEEVKKGDQAGACKAYLGQIKDPSGYKKDPKKDNKLPTASLELYHVFGFRHFYITDETRNMCQYLD